jgi:predicted kinase
MQLRCSKKLRHHALQRYLMALFLKALTSSVFPLLPNIQHTAYKMTTEWKQQSPRKLFIQMSGAPGSGKSTISRLLRRSIGNTVIIDHDILRSTLLESDMSFPQAAEHAYGLQWRLAQDFIDQDFNIIIDSTCNPQEVLDRGTTLAKDHDYSFWYVECKIDNIDLLDQRLRSRHAMTSQRTSVYLPPAAAATQSGVVTDEGCRALFKKWIEDPCRPTGNVIVVDSVGNSETARDHILERMVG